MVVNGYYELGDMKHPNRPCKHDSKQSYASREADPKPVCNFGYKPEITWVFMYPPSPTKMKVITK